MLEVALEPKCSLIPLLGCLGEQLHDDCRDCCRHFLLTLGWWNWLPRDMAMHPLHRIGRREWQNTGEHLVERDAERVEIAAGIDRAVHAPGLLRRHVGQCAGDLLGRGQALALTLQLRGETKAREPHLPVFAGDQDVGRLEVLVDQSTLVDPAQGRGDANGEVQEATHLHWGTEQSVERLAVGILEHQYGPAAFTPKLQRPQSPCTVQLVL